MSFIVALALAQVSAGNWTISEQSSELSGAKSYFASVQAKGVIAGILNTEKTPTLSISCNKMGLFVTIDWGDFIVNHESMLGAVNTTVSWKLDNRPIQKTVMDGNTTAAVMMGKKAFGWWRSLAGGKHLVLSVPDEHGGQEASFDIEGIDTVTARVAAMNCG